MMEKMIVSGVAADPDAARVAVIGLKDEPGVAFKLFNELAKHNINIDMILQSVGRHGTKDITFTCSDEDADEAAELIKAKMDFESIDVNKDVAKVSIVGAGMQSNAGVAAKMFEALYDSNINIRMISTSEIRVTVLINASETERAMNAIHDKFDLGSDK